jgi:hypothetical protein
MDKLVRVVERSSKKSLRFIYWHQIGAQTLKNSRNIIGLRTMLWHLGVTRSTLQTNPTDATHVWRRHPVF